MRGSSCLLLLLASAGTVVLAVPPNHSPYYRPSNRKQFRPSPQYDPELHSSTFLPPPTPSAVSSPKVTRSPPTPVVVPAPTKIARPPPTDVDLTPSLSPEPQKFKSSGNAAVDKLRQLLDVDRMAQGSQVHESKVEAAAAGHIPLVHALPQLTLLLQLLLHLLHQVVPVPPHLNQYHHSGALLHTHLGHGGHLAHGGHHHHHKGPYNGPGLYGVSASNNVLGRGPFPAYKYEDNAKK